MSTTTIVIILIAIIAILAIRSGGPRVTTITRTRKHESEGDER
jgi:hypothetical protein